MQMSVITVNPVLYGTREEWLNAFIDASRPVFEKAGAKLPVKVRASIGFPSKGRRSNCIGECWSDTNSADGTYEIFLRPSLDGANRIADVLTHELIHAAHGIKEGHGRTFKRTMTALGLIGKATATLAGEGWYAWALPIIESLGALPAAKLDDSWLTVDKKQKTRLIKCECTSCGFIMRTTATWLNSAAYIRCPDPDCGSSMNVGG